MLEPPTEPREPVDYERMREDLFESIMMDWGRVESIVWDYLREWTDDDVAEYFKDLDSRGRDEQERY